MEKRERPFSLDTTGLDERHPGFTGAHLERLLLERELHRVVCRYARACDERDWDAIDNDVFSADASADYGGWHLRDRAAIRAMLVSHLGGCGPTQHLLGNLVVEVDADADATVTSRTYVRAAHRGARELRDQTYECMGEYADRWVRTAQGWRIAHRRMTVGFEFGSRAVLRGAGV